jgi:hypothetical protein
MPAHLLNTSSCKHVMFSHHSADGYSNNQILVIVTNGFIR